MADIPSSGPIGIDQITADLREQRNPDGGWPYRAGQKSATEPTALALLALAASDSNDDAISTAADWLVARQRDDGFLTASDDHAEPSWLTPLAAIALHQAHRTDAHAAAVEALLKADVYTIPFALPGVYGFDTALAGWPWTAGDFSFTEPTALAVLCLKQAGYADHPRVRDGVAMLRDRAIAGGGWNYGEPAVLGSDLFATATPTALALMALTDEQDDATAAALDGLLGRQGELTSLVSLGWSATALNVLGRTDTDWRDDVTATYAAAATERRGPVEIALAILALTERTPHPLEISE